MCLTLRPGIHARRPYNKDNIRWKMMEFVSTFIDVRKQLRSYYFGRQGAKPVEVEQWLTAENKGDSSTPAKDIGFHVYVNKADAILAQDEGNNKLNQGRRVLVKVVIDDFVAAGKFDGVPSETWKRMNIVAVYDYNRKNITYRLRKKK